MVTTWLADGGEETSLVGIESRDGVSSEQEQHDKEESSWGAEYRYQRKATSLLL